MHAPKTDNTQESGIPPGLSHQLKQLKKIFSEDVLPSVKRHRYFVSRGQRKARSKTRKPNQFSIRFTPFAMTLGYGVTTKTSRPAIAIPPVFSHSIPQPAAQPNQLLKVMVIAIIQSNPPLYVLQKVQKKFAPGFVSGGIEDGETILQAAAREWLEETSGKDGISGADINRYSPDVIGEFVLNRATNGERAAVVLVEIPEHEKSKIIAGGCEDEEGEFVEEVLFYTFEQLARAAEENNILTNSKKALDVYLEYLVS